jgi:initiation factor 1A
MLNSMPNQKGGKGYKKGKHSQDEKIDVQMISWDASDGQMLGRVIRTLGQKRFRIYCNDNQERICRLAGSIRKSQWVSEGSVVVVSLRFLGSGSAGGGGVAEAADILHVVDTRLYNKLKKMDGVNENIFVQMEHLDIEQAKVRIAAGEKATEEDDLFDREDVAVKDTRNGETSDVDIDDI